MATTLHKAGEAHLRDLIEAGKYNSDQAWSFDADDGNKLLGPDGKDWDRYGSVHLGEDDGADPTTKGHWKYPAAKADGSAEMVFRKGLIAAKQRAVQQGERDIEDAAGALIDLIDEKEGGGKPASADDNSGDDKNGGDKPADEKPDAAAIVALTTHDPADLAPRAQRDLPRLMSRIFGTPLMIAPAKLAVIMAALGPRLGLAPGKPGAFFDSDPSDPAPDKGYVTTADGIAVLPIEGTLVNKSSWLGAMSGLVSYGDLGAALQGAVADPAVKGILLTVDSYGGECAGCFDLADAVFAARQTKPVHAVAADDAMSAAYALASAADRLTVSRTSGVGSIGVVAMHVDESGADKMDGLKYDFVYAGARKIDGNPHAPLSDAARTSLQAEVDRLQMLFAASVAKYRGLTADDLLAMEAAVFRGDNAVRAKLADAVGTPEDALAALRADIAARAAKAAGTVKVPSAEAGKVAAPSAEAGNVVQLADARPSAEGGKSNTASAEAAAARAVEILAACELAGATELASTFIQSTLSLADVRKSLIDRRAAASERQRIVGHITADATPNDFQAISASWDRAFAPYARRRGRDKE